MRKTSEFESLRDFGFEARLTDTGKVQYIKCGNGENTRDPLSTNTVYSNGDMASGKFFSLEEILSGGTTSVTIEDSILGEQAELSLNNNLPTSLAYLGSVYSTVQIAVNNIKSTYPNGFLVLSAIAGTYALMFNASDTYMYGGQPFSIDDYTKYDIIQSYSGVFDAKFTIIAQITGTTFSLFLELDGQPTVGAGYEHAVQPSDTTLDKYYSTLSQYEKDLLVPPHDRTNSWPRDLVVTNNILLTGTRYDDFIETELGWAANADDEDSNFIWRKLYPDGQKLLDDDGLVQKLVLAFAMNFDQIKRYQDQLKYQHTIGYENWNHISKDLVEILADQWNWHLGHNLNQDDYSSHIYSTYDNYVTGQSLQKISAKDVNFEIWRRVLANLVTLYKKKGTKEAIKYVANIYGLPEALLWIEELVEANFGSSTDIIESESNIVVPINGTMWYVDDAGSAKTMSYNHIRNTKYLNINISPVDAIEFDFYDWGRDHHPAITNVNGRLTTISGVSDSTVSDFFRWVQRNTIKSDGSARYDSRYPLLESEGRIYYTGSVNSMTTSELEPYMNFLDDNWNVLVSNLVPASSRIVSIGTLYRNAMWRREKHQWNPSELESKGLPFNEVVSLVNIEPVVKVRTDQHGVIEIQDPAAAISVSNLGQIDPITITSTSLATNVGEIQLPSVMVSMSGNPFGSIALQDPDANYVSAVTDSVSISCTYSSTTMAIASPILEPISGQVAGTSGYVDYTTDSLIVSNQTTIPILFSGYNLSDSGYTKFEFELFRMENDSPKIVDEDRVYSIMSTDYEGADYGVYRVSNLSNIDTYDYVSVESEFHPMLNKFVQITHMDTGTSQIRTSPKIGLFDLPIGAGGSRVNWIDVYNSGTIDKMGSIYHLGATFADIITCLQRISRGYAQSDIFVGTKIDPSLWSMFEWFTWQDMGVVHGSLLILEFLKGNKSFSFDTSDHLIVNMVSTNQTRATFKRVVSFFNWAAPIQSISYSNYPVSMGSFFLPAISTSSRTSGNTFSTTGTVLFGGLDYLNSEILRDKTEYFYRNRAITHAPKEWGNVSGLPIFPIPQSGGTLLDSGFDTNFINGIKYSGRYFMFMRTPNVPIATMQGLLNGATVDSSVTVRWNGVGDSDRLELQYTSVFSSNTPFTSYTGIPESAWTSNSGSTIAIQANQNVGDDYIYTIQTTLQPDTYYWWRVKNFRNKINMFGHNLEYFTSTQPLVFKTGGYSGGGRNEGELPAEAAPPTGIGKGGTGVLPQ